MILQRTLESARERERGGGRGRESEGERGRASEGGRERYEERKVEEERVTRMPACQYPKRQDPYARHSPNNP